MKRSFIKIGGMLCPADEEAKATMAKMPQHREIVIDLKRQRNPAFHRYAFASFRELFAMQDHFTDPDIFRRWLTMRAGYARIHLLPGGKQWVEPESLSFENMDELEFRECQAKMVQAFIDAFGIDLDRDELERAIRL